ncbi:MAG: ROK family glucokinase [Oscillospiraceae bacterium]|nr:ROK family glucokinase [Oscillospiraceae bacterium]
MKPYVFGVDVGGTAIKLGFFGPEGKLLKKWKIPTRIENSGSHILPDIVSEMEKTLAAANVDWADVEGVGIGIPSPVTEDGIVLRCINLDWGVFSIPERLRKLQPAIQRIRVANDVNAATLGEMKHGGGKGRNSIVMVTLGTGIGGGVIVNGKMVFGRSGAAGEIGHICVNPDETERCRCGHRGCLEQYCSATGLLKMTRRRMAQNPEEETVLRDMTDFTAKDICDAARDGDYVANDMLKRLGRRLGIALSAVAGTVDPDVILIGGGLSSAGDILFDKIITYYRTYAFHAYQDTEFALAKLGNDAGIYGCMEMVYLAAMEEEQEND